VSDFGNDFEKQENYSLLNSKVEYRRENLTAFLTVNNVTDRKYSEYGVLGGFPVEKAFFPSPERNFVVGASVHW
jgi:outer membrane receptor protein involved in Fe transport